MKKLFTVLLILIATAAVAQSKLLLDTTIHDFGTLKEGEKASYEFIFTNTGDQVLVILSVTQPCGCTIPTFSKEPLLPGQKSKISVAYDSEGHPGIVHKKLQIRCNDPVQYYDITITGEVLPKPVPAPPSAPEKPGRAE